MLSLEVTEEDIQELSNPEFAKSWLSLAKINGYPVEPFDSLENIDLQELAVKVLHLVLADLRESARHKQENMLH